MSSVFFFNDTATTEIYTLSLHDALPILREYAPKAESIAALNKYTKKVQIDAFFATWRSEEHTSELQSRLHLVCRLLLEKKKPTQRPTRVPPNPSNSTACRPAPCPPHAWY